MFNLHMISFTHFMDMQLCLFITVWPQLVNITGQFILLLFKVLLWLIEVTDCSHNAKTECRTRSKSAWLQMLEGGICGHPSALTGSDSVQRGPNYCLSWLIVVSEECIPTEVPGISLRALLKKYRPVPTSPCCVQRHCHKWENVNILNSKLLKRGASAELH